MTFTVKLLYQFCRY